MHFSGTPWAWALTLLSHFIISVRASPITTTDSLSAINNLTANGFILPIPESPLSISIVEFDEELNSNIFEFLAAEYNTLMKWPYRPIQRAYLYSVNGYMLFLHLERGSRIRQLDLAGAVEVMSRVMKAKGKHALEFELISLEGYHFADGGVEFTKGEAQQEWRVGALPG